MLSPEIIAEQVMGYAVGATELIPTLTPPDYPYTIAILPQGPHFYTGLLRAAGCLSLDPAKKKFLILSQETTAADTIAVESGTYESLGRTWKIDRLAIDNIAENLKSDILAKEHISQEIEEYLPFLRVIADAETIMHIRIGKTLSQARTKNLISLIKKRFTDHNIILLTNFALDADQRKKNERERISQVREDSSNKLLEIFRKIVDKSEFTPKIIAYVRPDDFRETGAAGVEYVCAVG